MTQDLVSLQKHAEQIVKTAADKLKPYFGNVKYEQKSNADYFDVVTELDKSTEKTISSELEKVDPSFGFYGEEFGQARKGKRQWILDPIDGTSLFIRGIPFCSTMLALAEGPDVLISIIVNIANGDVYTAIKDGGAKKNGKAIKVSTRSLNEAYIGFEINRSIAGNNEIAERFSSLSAPYKTMNSGWEFCMTAEGKLDGRIQKDPWGGIYDFAPGSLLVREAGGIVNNIGESTFDYRNLNIIATNKRIYSELTEGRDALFPVSKK